MAFRVDLPRSILRDLFDTKIGIYDRRAKAEPNQLIKEIILQDLQQLQMAKDQMVEITETPPKKA